MINLKQIKYILLASTFTALPLTGLSFDLDTLIVVPTNGALEEEKNKGRGGIGVADLSSYLDLTEQQKERIQDALDAPKPVSERRENLTQEENRDLKRVLVERELKNILTTDQWALYKERADQRKQELASAGG